MMQYSHPHYLSNQDPIEKRMTSRNGARSVAMSDLTVDRRSDFTSLCTL